MNGEAQIPPPGDIQGRINPIRMRGEHTPLTDQGVENGIWRDDTAKKYSLQTAQQFYNSRRTQLDNLVSTITNTPKAGTEKSTITQIPNESPADYKIRILQEIYDRIAQPKNPTYTSERDAIKQIIVKTYPEFISDKNLAVEILIGIQGEQAKLMQEENIRQEQDYQQELSEYKASLDDPSSRQVYSRVKVDIETGNVKVDVTSKPENYYRREVNQNNELATLYRNPVAQQDVFALALIRQVLLDVKPEGSIKSYRQLMSEKKGHDLVKLNEKFLNATIETIEHLYNPKLASTRPDIEQMKKILQEQVVQQSINKIVEKYEEEQRKQYKIPEDLEFKQLTEEEFDNLADDNARKQYNRLAKISYRAKEMREMFADWHGKSELPLMALKGAELMRNRAQRVVPVRPEKPAPKYEIPIIYGKDFVQEFVGIYTPLEEIAGKPIPASPDLTSPTLPPPAPQESPEKRASREAKENFDNLTLAERFVKLDALDLSLRNIDVDPDLDTAAKKTRQGELRKKEHYSQLNESIQDGLQGTISQIIIEGQPEDIQPLIQQTNFRDMQHGLIKTIIRARKITYQKGTVIPYRNTKHQPQTHGDHYQNTRSVNTLAERLRLFNENSQKNVPELQGRTPLPADVHEFIDALEAKIYPSQPVPQQPLTTAPELKSAVKTEIVKTLDELRKDPLTLRFTLLDQLNQRIAKIKVKHNINPNNPLIIPEPEVMDEIRAVYNQNPNLEQSVLNDTYRYIALILREGHNILPNQKLPDQLLQKSQSGFTPLETLALLLIDARAVQFDSNGDPVNSGKHYQSPELREEVQRVLDLVNPAFSDAGNFPTKIDDFIQLFENRISGQSGQPARPLVQILGTGPTVISEELQVNTLQELRATPLDQRFDSLNEINRQLAELRKIATLDASADADKILMKKLNLLESVEQDTQVIIVQMIQDTCRIQNLPPGLFARESSENYNAIENLRFNLLDQGLLNQYTAKENIRDTLLEYPWPHLPSLSLEENHELIQQDLETIQNTLTQAGIDSQNFPSDARKFLDAFEQYIRNYNAANQIGKTTSTAADQLPASVAVQEPVLTLEDINAKYSLLSRFDMLDERNRRIEREQNALISRTGVASDDPSVSQIATQIEAENPNLGESIVQGTRREIAQMLADSLVLNPDSTIVIPDIEILNLMFEENINQIAGRIISARSDLSATDDAYRYEQLRAYAPHYADNFDMDIEMLDESLESLRTFIQNKFSGQVTTTFPNYFPNYVFDFIIAFENRINPPPQTQQTQSGIEPGTPPAGTPGRPVIPVEPDNPLVSTDIPITAGSSGTGVPRFTQIDDSEATSGDGSPASPAPSSTPPPLTGLTATVPVTSREHDTDLTATLDVKPSVQTKSPSQTPPPTATPPPLPPVVPNSRTKIMEKLRSNFPLRKEVREQKRNLRERRQRAREILFNLAYPDEDNRNIVMNAVPRPRFLKINQERGRQLFESNEQAMFGLANLDTALLRAYDENAHPGSEAFENLQIALQNYRATLRPNAVISAANSLMETQDHRYVVTAEQLLREFQERLEKQQVTPDHTEIDASFEKFLAELAEQLAKAEVKPAQQSEQKSADSTNQPQNLEEETDSNSQENSREIDISTLPEEDQAALTQNNPEGAERYEKAFGSISTDLDEAINNQEGVIDNYSSLHTYPPEAALNPSRLELQTHERNYLYLTRQILENHGYTVEFEVVQKQGDSYYTVKLHYKKQPAQ